MTDVQRLETPFEIEGKRTFVAGHRGLLGSAIIERLASEQCVLLTADRAKVDLARQTEVESWFRRRKPDLVFVAAAKVGGILANDAYPADFIYENLMIEANIIHAAFQVGVEKLVFIGSTCIYPKAARQPIAETELLAGPLEPTNEAYAIAKIAGLKMCQAYRRQHGADFISCMPTNLYGANDNFDLSSSHVLPAFVRKVHDAKTGNSPSITIWGSGTPKREFLHAEDCADAIVFLMKHYSGPIPINVGSGREVSILNLARLIARLADYRGEIALDGTKPDGVPRKFADTTLIRKLGWRPTISLEEGIRRTLDEYSESVRLKSKRSKNDAPAVVG